MKKSSKPTVTIGIPAYNEEANIATLLQNILEQKFTPCRLDKIIIASDGCSDRTNGLVNKAAVKDPRIKLIIGHKRLGKSYRLSQLFAQNQSDYFIGLDADISITHPQALQQLVNPLLRSSNIGLTTLNNQPFPADNLFETTMNWLFKIWYLTRVDYHHGDNIYNHQGMAYATTNAVTQSVTFPRNLIADQHFLYIRIKSMGLKLKLVKKAQAYFYSPNNLHDFEIQGVRAIEEKIQLKHLLGDEIDKYFYLPPTLKRQAILTAFFKHPFLTIYSLACHSWLLLYLKLKHPQSTATWQIPTSTKRPALEVNV